MRPSQPLSVCTAELNQYSNAARCRYPLAERLPCAKGALGKAEGDTKANDLGGGAQENRGGSKGAVGEGEESRQSRVGSKRSDRRPAPFGAYGIRCIAEESFSR